MATEERHTARSDVLAPTHTRTHTGTARTEAGHNRTRTYHARRTHFRSIAALLILSQSHNGHCGRRAEAAAAAAALATKVLQSPAMTLSHNSHDTRAETSLPL